MAGEVMDVVVVGGGQAGLGLAYFLRTQGRNFTVLERGRIGESWRSQRWDSFTLNTPNWSNELPGMALGDYQADGFCTASDLVEYFEAYAAEFDLPIKENVAVEAIDRASDDAPFRVGLEDGGELLAHQVVVAAGIQRVPKVPALSEQIPAQVLQLHASEYRNPDALPEGAVVVVGSAQSGCQIAEDLLAAGRVVYLSTSSVSRVPRRYRGRDTLEWWTEAGMWDTRPQDLDDPAMEFAAQPQISGVGRFGRTISLQHMASQGARLMGRVAAVSDGVIFSDDTLAANIEKADAFSANVKNMIDGYIAANGIEAPPPEIDERDAPAPPGLADSGLTELDLADAGVTSVIWCTGFGGDFDWIHVPAFDAEGDPVHERGVAQVPGLYFLGFPWLYKRKSGIILGIAEDAEYLADVIAGELSAR